MQQMIVIAFSWQLAALYSAFMQLHGLFYLFLLYRKRRNIDLLVIHFARKRNSIVKKCEELKLWRLRQNKRQDGSRTGEQINDGEICSQAYHRKKTFANSSVRLHILQDPKSPNPHGRVLASRWLNEPG